MITIFFQLDLIERRVSSPDLNNSYEDRFKLDVHFLFFLFYHFEYYVIVNEWIFVLE